MPPRGGLSRAASSVSSKFASLDLGTKLGDLSNSILSSRRNAQEEVASSARATSSCSTSTLTPQPTVLTPEQRVARLRSLLQQEPVPLVKLKAMVFAEGVPDVGGGADAGSLRAITWKLALGYLPTSHADWEPHLSSQRRLYADWVKELTVDPNAKAADAVPGELQEASDDPLNTDEESVWREWHVDEELRHEIRKVRACIRNLQ